MKKPKARKPKDEDAEQSRRFVENARELEAAGELNLTEGAESFDKLTDSLLRPIRGGGDANAVRQASENKK